MWGQLRSALLLHGMTGGPTEMQELGQLLERRGLTTCIPRLSGHETSLKDLARTSLETWLEETRNSLLQMEPPFILIGLSFGSLLTLALAEEFPQLVAGTVLLSPPFRFRRPIEQLMNTASLLPESYFRLLTGPLGYLKKVPRPNALALERNSYQAHSIAAVLRLIKLRRRVLENLSRLICPTLLIQDPFDHHLDPNSYKIFTNKYPSKFRLLPNAQHELTLSHMRDQVFFEIEQFISGIKDAP